MKQERIVIASLFIFLVFIANCVQEDSSRVLKGPYLGQKPPGMTPEVFAPGFVSTGMGELNNVFSADGKEFYFSVRLPGVRTVSMMQMSCVNNRWSEPRLLPFASRYGDIDMSIAPDDSKFFFCSRRPPQEGGVPNEDFDFWMSEKTGEEWGTPQHLGDGVNSDSEDFYPVFTNLNHLYFNSQREGRGTNNIYRAMYTDGKFGKAVKLGPAVNTEYREFDPYAAPDESFIIFASERPGGFGRSDLYISFKKEDGAWTPAVNMGERINSEGSDFCPMLSPDGKYLFFTSNRSKLKEFPENPMDYTTFWKMHIESQNGLSDIYWVDANIIEDIKSDNR